ncbi:iron chelate uptake ABC transporter family permease subunit, partial [Rhodovulum sulfidophilum]|nr:iron chelate uptake ABC transporter family permease subunit [Rhodovulum sulfidophilum]
MPLSPATPSLARRAALPTAFAALSLASLLIGAKDIGIGWIFDPSPEALLVLTASRLPRLIALVLTGMGLAISGVILQQILRNRFAEPATTGGMEAAKLGILE